ncbi:MAG: hypothetical protein ABL308_05520 [Oceanicaulis sp.]
MTRIVAALIFVLGAIGLVFAALVEPAALLRAWLTAWLVLIAAPIGAVFAGLTMALAPGPWTEKIAQPIRLLLLSLPVLSLGVIPVLFGLGELYPWISPGEDAAHWVEPRGAWQEPLWFALRQIVWLAILSGAALALATGRLGSQPVAGLVAIPVTLAASFFALDISMSLDAAFNSTIFGLYVIAGQAAAALGVAITARVLTTDEAESVAGRPVWLLFGACALWGYHAFFQYLIIWSGDLPRYAEWFLARNQGVWLIVIFVYAMLFARAFLLLIRPVRKRSRGLVTTAGGVAVGVGLETIWRTAPDLDPTPGWWAALTGWLALFAGLGALVYSSRRRREAAHA